MKISTFIAASFAALPAAAQESPAALADAFAAAVVAEDAAAMAALYTEDAVSFGPGGRTVIGPEAIAASWTHFFDGFDGFTVTLDKMGSNDLGKKSHAAWGHWTMSATPAGGGDPVTWKGRFMDVSVKTKSGWKYQADHASMAAPAED